MVSFAPGVRRTIRGDEADVAIAVPLASPTIMSGAKPRRPSGVYSLIVATSPLRVIRPIVSTLGSVNQMTLDDWPGVTSCWPAEMWRAAPFRLPSREYEPSARRRAIAFAPSSAIQRFAPSKVVSIGRSPRRTPEASSATSVGVPSLSAFIWATPGPRELTNQAEPPPSESPEGSPPFFSAGAVVFRVRVFRPTAVVAATAAPIVASTAPRASALRRLAPLLMRCCITTPPVDWRCPPRRTPFKRSAGVSRNSDRTLPAFHVAARCGRI